MAESFTTEVTFLQWTLSDPAKMAEALVELQEQGWRGSLIAPPSVWRLDLNFDLPDSAVPIHVDATLGQVLRMQGGAPDSLLSRDGGS